MALVTPWGRIETLPVVIGGQTDHVQGMRFYDASGALLPATSEGLGVDIKVVRGNSTAVVTFVVADATSEKLFKAANASRRGLSIRNQTPSEILIKYGNGVSSTSFTDVIPPYTTWACDPGYQGAIYGVYSATDPGGSGVTEW